MKTNSLLIVLMVIGLIAAGCVGQPDSDELTNAPEAMKVSEVNSNIYTALVKRKSATIYFCGGCFWGVEEYFPALKAYMMLLVDMRMAPQKIHHMRM